jgi:hypothetical protein
VHKAFQAGAATKSAGKQPAIKKPDQENVTLSNSSISTTLAKCQNLLEVSTVENLFYYYYYYYVFFLKKKNLFKIDIRKYQKR